MIKHFLKIVLRNLHKNRLETIINLIGISTSFCVAIIIFTFVNKEYSFDKFNEKIDRIYMLEEGNSASMCSAIGIDLSNNFPEVQKSVRFNLSANTLFFYERSQTSLNNIVIPKMSWADSVVFDIFDFEFVYGSPQTALKRPFTIVLTEAIAKRFFKSEDPIGKMITNEYGGTYEVTAVIKNIENFHLELDAIASFSSLAVKYGPTFNYQFQDGWQFPTYILTINNELRENLVAKINAYYYEKYTEEELGGMNLKLIPLKDVYFSEISRDGPNGSKTYVFILITIAVFILVIATINFVNLSTAKFQQRIKQIGIKKIVGATRVSLMTELLLESVIISFISLHIGFILAEVILNQLNSSIISNIQMNIVYQFPYFVLFVGFSFFMGVLAGIYPAVYFTSINPLAVFKKISLKGKKGLYLRRVLIIFQFVISIVLIISTITINKQNNFLLNKELGFQKASIIHLEMNAQLYRNLEAFKTKVRQHLNVLNTSYSCRVPGTNFWSWNVSINDVSFYTKVNSIDPDFIDLYEIELLEGRNFDWEIQSDKKSKYIMNEAAVKHFGLERPISGAKLKDFSIYDKNVEIIGVVKDFHFKSLHHIVEPLLFYWSKNAFNTISIKIQSEHFYQTIELIEEDYKSICPNHPFTYRILNETYDELYQNENKLLESFEYLALLSILIACLGLFGLASFLLEQKTKEIGIRKVNGASTFSIIILLLKDFVKWILVAFVIACPIAYYFMDKWLENFAFHTELNLIIFLIAGILATAIGILTISFQAFIVANKNPIESLKYE